MRQQGVGALITTFRPDDLASTAERGKSRALADHTGTGVLLRRLISRASHTDALTCGVADGTMTALGRQISCFGQVVILGGQYQP